MKALRSSDQSSELSTTITNRTKTKNRNSYQVQSVFYIQILAVCVRSALHLYQLLGEKKTTEKVFVKKASGKIPHNTVLQHYVQTTY